MVAAIIRLLPMSTQLRKYAAGDVIPSLTRLKKLEFELKFLVSIFQKHDQINILNRGKWQPPKNVRFFVIYIFHTYRTINPPPCRAETSLLCILLSSILDKAVHNLFPI